MNVLQPILELTRGHVVESTHFGSIAIVDSNGKLLHSYGDPYGVAFLRSSALSLIHISEPTRPY